MARGNENNTPSFGDKIKGSSFIAYQDEEHGLGYRAAASLSAEHGRPSRRLTTADTLSALITEKANKAVVPLQNDRGGFNVETLMTLLDFKDFTIEGENVQSDNYCLAAPSASIHEIAQASFPGTYDGKAAVGPFPRDRQLQNSFRKRVEVVYASSDAFERCASTIDELRASGVQVIKLQEGTDPYREVLNLSRESLDPDRKITTQMHDNKHIMTSNASASAYSKPLIGVLLPQDVAVGSSSGFNPATGVAVGADFNGDFVILDDHLADRDSTIETRFLVLNKPEPKKPAANGARPTPAKAGILPRTQKLLDGFNAQRESNETASYVDFEKSPEEKFIRILLKLDTRGPNTADISDITQELSKAGIYHQPIYLHDRPDTLPVILEIQLNMDEDASGSHLNAHVRNALSRVWDKANIKQRNHNPRLLGTFATATNSFQGVEKREAIKDYSWIYLVGLLALLLLGMPFLYELMTGQSLSDFISSLF